MMRKDRISLEGGPTQEADAKITAGTSSVQMIEITGKHIHVPFPRRFANQPRGDCFDTIRNCIALLDKVSDIDISTSCDECHRYVNVR